MGGGKWGVKCLMGTDTDIGTDTGTGIWGDQKFLEMDGDDNCITM